MPLDPQISLSAGNYLTQNGTKSWTQDPSQLNSLVGTANALNTLQAKQAIGQATQQAIDPATGQLDTNKLMGLISQNPKAAYGAPDAVTQAIAQAHGNLANMNSTAQLAANHMDVLGQTLAPLLGKVDPATGQSTLGYGDMVDAAALMLNRPESERSVDTPQVIKFLSAQPQDDSPASRQIRMNNLKQLELQRAGIGDLLKQIMPTPEGVNTGSAVQSVTRSPISGVQQAPGPAANIPLNPSPEWANTVGPGPLGPNNVTTAMTNAQRARMAQGLPPNGAPPAANGLPTNGRYPAPPAQAPAAGAPPAAQGAAAITPGTALPGGGYVSGAAPGVTETQAEALKQGMAKGQDLQDRADMVPERKAALDNMLTDLDKAPSGPGSVMQRSAEALAQRTLGFGLTLNKDQVAAMESFDKLSNQIALQQASQAHATDLSTKTAMGANPGHDYSKLGNQQLIGMLKGNEDYISAKNRSWQNFKTSVPPGGAPDYGSFSTNFNNIADPRVFQSQYMSPQQKADMYKSMSKDEQKAFRDKYNTAVGAGWLPDPRSKQSAP